MNTTKTGEAASGIRVTFCTGVGTVTGANFLLETAGGTKILVDCGLVQGEQVALDENREPFLYQPSAIQALLITHAHLDHVGRIPPLVKQGFAGAIYSTPETKALAELVLTDAVGIITNEARQQGKEPLYDQDDVHNVFRLWKTVPYHQQAAISADVSFMLKDAGHILGSSMIEVSVKTGAAAVFSKLPAVASLSESPQLFKNSAAPVTTLLFTGDLGNSPHPLLCDTEPVGEADILIMESTYGDRNHESREERVAELQRVITETLGRGGTLVIPTFSIDRTQVLLYELNNLVAAHKIPSVPVFVDSPMAIKATDIYRDGEELFNPAVREQIRRDGDIFSFPHLEFTISQGESRDIERMKGAKIILAGSGMSVGGRVVSHEEHFLPDPKNALLLVGYQAAGSLGRELADGAKKVTIHGHAVEVKARVETLYGFSGHKDGDHLVQFVATASERLKQVFVVMGEPGASMHLAQRLNDELGVKAIVPERRTPYQI